MQTEPRDQNPAAALPESSPHEPSVRPWELELLISGAVVFSLLQLPGWVDDQLLSVRTQVSRGALIVAFMLYVYIKVSLYTLIVCFLIHLAGRGYWVGLIGLESVYPRGIRWDNTNYGPVMKEMYRERLGRIQQHIDAADRFCSVLFPLAFSLVSLCAYSLGLMGLMSGLAYLGTLALGSPDAFGRMFMGVVAAFTVLPMLQWVADRHIGERAQPGSAAHRRLRRLTGVVLHMNAIPAVGVMFITLFSNARRTLQYPVIIIGILTLFLYVFAHDVMMREGLLRMGGSAFYPDDAGELAVEDAYYANRHQAGEVYERAPNIQSDIIREPYVRLFIPFVPMLHGESLPEGCPGLRALSPAGVRVGRAENADTAASRAMLACWARLQPVSLNGRRIAPAFRFATDARTGLRGIVAHISVQGLPRGENLLEVAPPPRSAGARRRSRRQPDPAYIYFWL